MRTPLQSISPAEEQIIILYRALDPHSSMTITKQKGQQECRIDIERTVFLNRDVIE